MSYMIGFLNQTRVLGFFNESRVSYELWVLGLSYENWVLSYENWDTFKPNGPLLTTAVLSCYKEKKYYLIK